MDIVVAQLNPTVGDLEGNTNAILSVIRTHRDADLIVFPELAVTGYWPGDLIERRGFLQERNACLAHISKTTKGGPAVLIGCFEESGLSEKRHYNALHVYRDGALTFSYRKRFLPTYNVFDEARQFAPGPVEQAMSFELTGLRLGVLLCEDGWLDTGGDDSPVARMASEKPDLVLHINASPSVTDRYFDRRARFDALSLRHGLPWLYVNQVGGNDEVVYDGASFAIHPDKGSISLRAQLPAYEEAVQRICFNREDGFGPSIAQPPVRRGDIADQQYRQILLGLRDYLRKCGFEHVVIGSSGGIDSALTMAVAVDALGADRVAAITMPSRHSSAGSISDSAALCRNLGIQRFYEISIEEEYALAVARFEQAFGEPPGTITRENIQARLRGRILMEYSNHFDALLLSTGNKSELAVGYCTLYGDMSGGLNLLGDIPKTEVYGLARYFNALHGREVIPTAIIDKAPSAELSDGQKDEDSLPPYDVLDAILALYVESDLLTIEEETDARTKLASVEASEIERVLRLIDRAEYKRRQSPPIIRVHRRAFGIGRRLPIAQRHCPGPQSVGLRASPNSEEAGA